MDADVQPRSTPSIFRDDRTIPRLSLLALATALLAAAGMSANAGPFCAPRFNRPGGGSPRVNVPKTFAPVRIRVQAFRAIRRGG